VTTILLDGNAYNKLQLDVEARSTLRALVARGRARVIATPMILDELRQSPFGGPPNWFPIAVETESVTVPGYVPLGMTRLGDGQVYDEHRGESSKIPDAIIADSASALADILVSEDRRCRERLKRISTRCCGMDYAEFREWLRASAVATS
jgi:hypothetical protein